MNAADTPLAGPPPPEVPLTDPPLVRVIAQVRFPLIASLEKRESIASFQEAIREFYPVLRPEEERSVVLGSQGVVDTRSNTLWRFNEVTGAWRVTLAPDFLALETTKYTSREDFMERLRLVLEALKEHVDPRVLDRLGVRYIDRVSGENMSALPRLVRPEVAGILGSPLSEHAQHAVSENMFILPGNAGQITVRWGLLAPRSTTDPGALDAINERSWILDTDAFQSFQAGSRRLDVDSVVEQARGFAARIYAIFRWAVTDEFLRRYGGEP
ncbi:MAG: TIGR04255 family protein [Gemmatimonadota bacterium]|nr:TIGR04255 family protein [Gemmatimonadota bacterium]MDE2871442.1 TIGR04255 family protein [Gemmatimonadota bacterium]